jgi:putative toxin-antitoxin system antitoxin component (TIGR02293 family)
MAKADEIQPIAKPKPGPGKRGNFVDVASAGRAAQKVRRNTRPAGRAASARHVISVVQRVAKISFDDRSGLLQKVRIGLSYSAVETLAETYDSSLKEIGEVLHIPTSTMSRRKKSGKLNPDESDRVVRYARIMDAATELMNGDADAAAQWMRTPRKILGGETPLAHASTEIGARDVEDLINRLEHGVFS